ncbi:MAG: hypothetical protein AAGA46_07745 [Cyanobacteria bacterium P01_F01_bin.13]
MQAGIEQLKILDYYGKKFCKIRVDRAHGVAPHKPILLLSVIEHFQKAIILENKIFLSCQLNQCFLKYWSYLGSASHNPDISKPFFFMKSGKFWHLMPRPKYRKILSKKIKLKTFSEVQRAIEFAYLDEDLFDLLKQTKSRNCLRTVLISRWFPGRLSEILEISETDISREPPIYTQEAYEKFYELGYRLSL